MPIFRWDIDKTYLETDFESLAGLWKAATEEATEKIATDGVVPLVKALQSIDDAQTIFLSGSPIQMRNVLLEKFRLDGVAVDEIILKDSARAIAKGRFSELTNQFGHKLPSLLEHRASVQESSSANLEYLFGDDVEQDALIYLTYQLIIEGQLDWKDLKKICRRAGALTSAIERIRNAYGKVSKSSNVIRGIFIRLTKHSIPDWMWGLMPHLIPVHTWSQAGIKLWIDGAIDLNTVLNIAEHEGTTPLQLANLVQDLQFRSIIQIDEAESVLNALHQGHRSFLESGDKNTLRFENIYEAMEKVS